MKQISADALAEKLQNKENVNIIDVREDFEVAEGKIPEAIHIPLGEIEKRVNELDKNEHYYLVCRSGGRSGNACGFLDSQGFDVTNMTGGMLAWNGEVK
ncbi:rhodanese-like domain-containing protein [Paraliobacillus salinarum]|uniref:rhodanese-like domain-containing protein n=1 Tax=Paraliobacillus salinarum TaxID=1158996 RepID=UPI0015F61076|nr:rhodanese-like domain-containing protein [Paraliobacillus salinarum]